MGWVDILILAGRNVLAVHLNSEITPRPRIELRSDTHPLDELGRIREVGEDNRRRCGDVLFDFDDGLASGHPFDLLRSSASAAKRKRSMLRDHMLRR